MPANPRGLGRVLTLHIRLNEAERKALNDAAAISGLSISSWSRMVLRKAAIADHHAAGRKADL
jgi:uncharacterized protein (DUF1778 family)